MLDANVLFPFTLRDTPLRAAAEGCFQVYWSEQILDEATRNPVETGAMRTDEKTRPRSHHVVGGHRWHAGAHTMLPLAAMVQAPFTVLPFSQVKEQASPEACAVHASTATWGGARGAGTQVRLPLVGCPQVPLLVRPSSSDTVQASPAALPVQATTGGGGVAGGAQTSVPEADAVQAPLKVCSSKVTVQAAPEAMPVQAATAGGGGMQASVPAIAAQAPE